MTESCINKKLIGLCKLYRGGNNPFNKQESEFEWYVWRFESVIVSNASKAATIAEYNLGSEESYEEYFKTECKAALDMFADVPYSGNPSAIYDKYFCL